MSSSSAPEALEVVRVVDDDYVRHMLREAVALDGTQRAYGIRVGVDPAIISAVVNAKRPPTAALYRALGVEKVMIVREGAPR